jgi:hypothetical protein
MWWCASPIWKCDLEMPIAVKEELGFPKDVAVLPVPRQALKERSERQR